MTNSLTFKFWRNRKFAFWEGATGEGINPPLAPSSVLSFLPSLDCLLHADIQVASCPDPQINYPYILYLSLNKCQTSVASIIARKLSLNSILQ
jgi:hypothetical protein